MKTTLLRPLSILLAASIALAPAAAAAQQAALPDPNTWLNAAQQAAQMIDKGKAGELWEGGSAEMKRKVARKDFVASIKKLRGAGAVTAREWVALDHAEVAAAPGVPAGHYVNVRFRAAMGKRVVSELVTFRQEADGGWRWMGYLMQ